MHCRQKISLFALLAVLFLLGCSLSRPCEIPGQIVSSVEKLSSTGLRRIPECREVRASEARRMLLRSFHESNSAQDLFAEERTLMHLGFLPFTYPYTRKLLGEYGRRTAGFYSPKNKSLTLVRATPTKSRERLLAHELTHVIQDQNVGIKNIIIDDATTDLSLARLAILEGEANVAMKLALGEEVCLQQGERFLIDKLREKVIFGDNTGIVKSLQLLMDFPYLFGEHYACSLYERTRLFKNEEYLKIYSTAQFFPWRNEIAGSAVFHESKAILDSGVLSYSDSLGMYGLFALLVAKENFSEVLKLASDWQGDNVSLRTAPDKEIFEWRVLFSTAESAAGFYRLYRDLNNKRFKMGAKKDSRFVWSDRNGTRNLALDGKAVTFSHVGKPSGFPLNLLTETKR